MIGIFDSGVGGMTVAHAVEQALPGFDLVYFGDLARTPYGSKSPETIRRYTRENIDFLLSKGAQLIIVACNSAASVINDEMLAPYALPIFDVIRPAVARVVSMVGNSSVKSKVGVIGTRATIASGIYEKKIKERKPEAQVYSTACPLLVPLVEEGWLKRPETRMIIKNYLHPLKMKQIDTLILGCTHYPLLIPIIEHKIGKRVRVISSSNAVAEQIKSFLAASPELDGELSKTGHTDFFVSDITPQFEKVAKSVIRQHIELKHVNL